ncbi:hypothetical protein [Bacillus sp. CGMCC 1.16541]|uniref:hypothetical protein n=1 Tax=Bacillus sp. CGMCC 1.16541 TaxID=2185143 RepID=UPI000D72B599|nr:hypothetical protein [Bacillus sp. CGMCC 1.16541]
MPIGSTLVYNRQTDPLFVSMTSSLTSPTTVVSAAETAAFQGRFFESSTGSQSVAANGFLVVQYTIPANSNRTVYIQRVSGGATTNTTIDILFNATFAAAGTTITPVNSNLASAITSVVTGKYLSQATDPTTGGTRVNSIIQTGGPVVIDYSGRIIIPSTTTDRTFYIRLANNTNQTNILSVNVSWWELVS